MVPIHVPSLVERMEDIPLLVEDLMNRLASGGLGKKKFFQGAMEVMCRHSWPGNVRELKNFIERMAIMCPTDTISGEEVSLFLSPTTAAPPSTVRSGNRRAYQAASFKEAKKCFEQEYLQQKLTENDGNISQTAEQVGMERSHLHKKLKSLGIVQ